MTGEKRKRSSTIRSNAKRQSSTPATPTPAPAPPTTITPIPPPDLRDPRAPTNLPRDGSLNILSKPQPDNLELKDYKSVAESKVLSEALARSARKWTDGGVFDRFWIKPLKSRRIDPLALERNPQKESMIKLGNATMVVEPHRFEVKLYGVLAREHTQTPGPPPPMHQYGGPHYAAGHPVHNYQGHAQQPTPQVPAFMPRTPSVGQTPQPIPGQGPAPAPNGFNQNAPGPLPPGQAAPQTPLTPGPRPSGQQQSAPLPQSQAQPPAANAPQPGQPVAPKPDPVIQALALRAASNPTLKALMRIVASGKASADQLRVFQSHIDAISNSLKNQVQQNTANAQAQQGSSAQATGGRPTPQGSAQQSAPPQTQQFITPSPAPSTMTHSTPSQHSNATPQHQYQPSSPFGPSPMSRPPQSPIKPRTFPQAPRQEVVAVVMEFDSGYNQGDRFIFPKYAVLEYRNHGTVLLASFIVLKREEHQQTRWESVTVTFESSNPKNIEAFSRVCADQESTYRYMQDVISKFRKSDERYLAYRIPRPANDPVPDTVVVEHKPVPYIAPRERRKDDRPTHSRRDSTHRAPAAAISVKKAAAGVTQS